MNTERELTNDELDAVSGGVANANASGDSGGWSLPVNYEAMTVWNTLLGQYGFSHGGIWPPY
jgi:bacteriocin-like protein